MSDAKPFFFGKLPDHDDFVRQNALGPDFRILDQWLQEGLFQAARHFSSELAEVYQAASPYQFCFQAEAADQVLIGIVWPSHDRSGRKFPFVVAIRDARDGLVPGMVPYAPVLYKEFLRQSGELASSAMNGQSLPELISGLGRLSAPGLEDMSSGYQRFQAYLDGTMAGEFWSRQLGDPGGRSRFLLVRNLLEALGPSASGRPVRSSLGLRFPMGEKNSSHQEDACFWVLLVSQVARDPKAVPHMIWGIPRPGERSYLFVFLNRPPGKTLIPLLRPEVGSDVVYRLDEENREDAARVAASLPPRLRSALESTDRSLRDLLGEIMPR